MQSPIKVRQESDITIVNFAERLNVDIKIGVQLKEVLADLARNNTKKVIIDMENVDYFDSAGIGFLLSGIMPFSQNSGMIALCCLNENIQDLFIVIKMDKIFQNFYSTLEDARQSLQ
jgi:anti-sigma B factor antagonist